MKISGTILGFDYGTRRTGVAVGQRLTGTAHPLLTLNMKNGLPSWPSIDHLMKDWAPDGLVVGRPTRMDGESTPLTVAAETFAESLRKRYALPVSLIDERLSSREAEAELKRRRTQGSRGPIRKDEIDREAAAVLLHDWLTQNPLSKLGNDCT